MEGVQKETIENNKREEGEPIIEESKVENTTKEEEKEKENHVESNDFEQRFNDILSISCECIQPEELRRKLLLRRRLICYDGFEPSGRMHVAQGLLKSLIVNKLTKNGCIYLFWIADWFAQLNNKMGGDINKIRKLGKYFIEVWKSCGMNMEHVQFLWASEEINRKPDEYWSLVIDISRSFNITRIKRCLTIMGRTEGEDNYCSQILYPCMQCADIFFLNVDICQLGMDQRKVNMLAREYCDIKQTKKDKKSKDKDRFKTKPIILSHPMLPGLLEGQEKMSKSNEDSAIFMDDSEADVNKKIKKAFCPPGITENNPIFAYAKMIIFEKYQQFHLLRKEKDGGNKLYTDIVEFEKDYQNQSIHPLDLKDNVARYLNEMIEPVRQHFQNNAEAKALLKEIKMYKVTR